VINHIVGGAQMFAGSARGLELPAPVGDMPDFLGDDPSAAYRDAAADLIAAYGSDRVLQGTVTLPWGEMPGDLVLGVAMADHLVHAWDLACATGQPVPSDENLALTAMRIWEIAIEPEERDGDTYAAAQVPPAGATPFEEMIAFTGRSVRHDE
jgi:uncharacterized protein (TIGR03086 family)